MTASTTPDPGERAPRAAWLRDWAPSLLLIALLLVARSSLANHYHVPSGSMQPTLQPGDRVLVDMRAYGVRVPFTGLELWGSGRPAPGDVVVFRSPADGTRLIKRVVAVGGQTVALVGATGVVLLAVPEYTKTRGDFYAVTPTRGGLALTWRGRF